MVDRLAIVFFLLRDSLILVSLVHVIFCIQEQKSYAVVVQMRYFNKGSQCMRFPVRKLLEIGKENVVASLSMAIIELVFALVIVKISMVPARSC